MLLKMNSSSNYKFRPLYTSYIHLMSIFKEFSSAMHWVFSPASSVEGVGAERYRECFLLIGCNDCLFINNIYLKGEDLFLLIVLSD